MGKHPDPAWRGISRVDHKHTHGWLTRIYLSKRRTIAKLFSDRKCGGKEAALEQARHWRDTYPVAEEDRPNPEPYRYLKTLPKNNSTGRVGVNRTMKRNRNGSFSPCFQVSWSPEPYHPRNKAFYISLYHSEEEAFQAACAFRAEKEREIEQSLRTQPRRRRSRTKATESPSNCNDTP